MAGRGLWEEILSIFFPYKCRVCGRNADLPLCPDCVGSFSIFAGPWCRLCGVSLEADNELCPSCQITPPSYDLCRSAFLYGGALRHSIRLLKFGGRYEILEPVLYTCLARFNIIMADVNFDLAVPAPSNPSLKRRRKKEVAVELARILAESRGVPVLDCIRLDRDVSPQYRLAPSERWRNVKGAFRVDREDEIAGKTVLLVDDIITTGATAEEAGRALKKAGAGKVYLFTLCRVARPGAGKEEE